MHRYCKKENYRGTSTEITPNAKANLREVCCNASRTNSIAQNEHQVA